MKVQDQDTIPYNIQRVHQLIIYGKRRWNEELIRDSFSVKDAESII